MVQSDFCVYYILCHYGDARVIDVGQAVTSTHPHAEEFLVRDVTRLVEWAQRQGVDVELAEAMANVLY